MFSSNQQVVQKSEVSISSDSLSMSPSTGEETSISYPTVNYSVAIDYNRLEFGRMLGEGVTAEVQFAKWHGVDIKEVAVKKFKTRHDTFQPGSLENLSIKLFKSEEAILQKLASFSLTHSLQYYGYTVNPESNYSIVTEYLPGGELFDLIGSGPIPLIKIYTLLIQIAEAIKELHDRNIIHADLKTENILLDANGNPKLADFGATVFLESGVSSFKSEKYWGTPSYSAPEVIENKNYSKASDIFALGSIMFVMVERGVPLLYGNKTTSQEIFNKVRLGIREKITEKSPPNIAELIRSCWEQDPGKRPTIGSLLARFHIFRADEISREVAKTLKSAAAPVATHTLGGFLSSFWVKNLTPKKKTVREEASHGLSPS